MGDKAHRQLVRMSQLAEGAARTCFTANKRRKFSKLATEYDVAAERLAWEASQADGGGKWFVGPCRDIGCPCCAAWRSCIFENYKRDGKTKAIPRGSVLADKGWGKGDDTDDGDGMDNPYLLAQ